MYKVTILITTYNLKAYIREAIESVLNQKTDFLYRILIADDASTDGTKEILKDYEEKYPEKIKLIAQKNNLGSLRNSICLYEDCKTEYFAFLDGDDYWLDNTRLQRQVDFLEKNKEFVICGGNTQFFCESKRKNNKTVVHKRFLGKSYSIEDYYNQKVPFVHTSSILFRNIIFKQEVPQIYYQVQNTFEEPALRGEDFRFLIHLSQGKMMLFEDTLSVYRIHDKGVWQGAGRTIQLLESVIYYNFCKKYWNEHRVYFDKLCQNAYIKLMQFLIKEKNIDKFYELNEKEHFYFISILEEIYQYRINHVIGKER